MTSVTSMTNYAKQDIQFRADPELTAQLRQMAAYEGESLNAIVKRLTKKAVAEMYQTPQNVNIKFENTITGNETNNWRNNIVQNETEIKLLKEQIENLTKTIEKLMEAQIIKEALAKSQDGEQNDCNVM